MKKESLGEVRTLIFLIVYLIFLWGLYGIKTADVGEILILNQNPFRLIAEPARQFLHGSILPIILGHALGIANKSSFLMFYGCIIAITWISLLFLSRQRFHEKWPIFVLFITAWPLYHVNLEWIGKSDSLLLFGYIVLFFMAGPYKVLGALVVILSHKEMGALIILFELAYSIRNKETVGYILAGAGLGLFCHWLYLNYGLDSSPRDRLKFMLDALPNYYWPYIAAHWYLFIVFLLGPIGILLSMLRIVPDRISVACLFTGLCFAMVTMDTSRSFVMVSIPAIFHLGENAMATGRLKFDRGTVLKLIFAQVFVFEIISPPMKDWGRSFYHLVVSHIL